MRLGDGRRSSEGPSELLRLDGVSKAYPGVIALDRVDLALKAGEVHAIVGENGAGKSTLMGVLYGLVRADEGQLYWSGAPVSVTSPRQARDLGIGLVQQHFSLIPTLTAAQNLMLALGDTRAVRGPADAKALLASIGQKYGLTVSPDVPVEQLPISQQQRAEILKALAGDVKVIALDEPNALLTPDEWSQLAEILRRLADDGVAVVLISHKLDDVMALADRVTVLRRGRVVASTTTENTDASKLGALMVGALAVAAPVRGTDSVGGTPYLNVEDLTIRNAEGAPSVAGVSLRVKRGEIVGLAGVEGSGQVELTEAIAGVCNPDGGRISVDSEDITAADIRARQRRGIAYVPADRLASGMVADLSVAENMLLPVLSNAPYTRFGILRLKRINQRAAELIEEFDIRVAGPGVSAGTLSGGNQQKMVLARELSRNPALIVCCYATRGLDFAAAAAVRDRVVKARDAGAAVLYASVDLDELLELCDRIVVMHGGQAVGEITRAEADAELVGALMGGRRAS